MGSAGLSTQTIIVRGGEKVDVRLGYGLRRIQYHPMYRIISIKSITLEYSLYDQAVLKEFNIPFSVSKKTKNKKKGHIKKGN
jgi:hypothetical protein